MNKGIFSLVFYVPDSHLEAVKAAVFAAGAGELGNYDQCCWQTRGTGQFRPLAGSDPAIGSQGRLEKVEEWKVEIICSADRIQAAVEALLQAHPYETVAYLVVKPHEA